MIRFSVLQALLLATVLACKIMPVQATGIGESALLSVQKRTERNANSSSSGLMTTSTNTRWRSNNYGSLIREQGDIKPFGAQLFQGGFATTRERGVNNHYTLLPGDMITLRLWGLVEMERQVPVDSQGNIFLPTIGPVYVQGATQAQMNQRVTSAVKSLYSDGVRVYTQLQGVQPIGVYVTGFVKKPGRYAGTPSDSVIYFLNQAGGIDARRGSYRTIKIMREGSMKAGIDLYAFLREGNLPNVQLEEGDTVIVEPRRSIIQVRVDGINQQYELNDRELYGRELMPLLQLSSQITHTQLMGFRDQEPFYSYQTLSDFKKMPLFDGDQVEFLSDARKNTIIVQLEGSFEGRSRFVLPNNTKLNDFLRSIAVRPAIADTGNLSIRRTSVAAQQKASLNESLARLEATYLGAPSSTVQEAEIRAREAELIRGFVKRASQVAPSGRLVVATEGTVENIRLQDGDVITIPERSDSIMISGEVLVPQAVVFRQGRTVNDYILGAGGFSQHADKNKILIVRMNGEVVNADNAALRSGDEILVLPKVPTKNLQMASSISQILYQIAIAARVVLDL